LKANCRPNGTINRTTYTLINLNPKPHTLNPKLGTFNTKSFTPKILNLKL